jgi:type I restriction enzyme S subunit
MATVSESGIITVQDERPFAEVSKGYTYFAEGDVLMAKITPCMENGKATFVHKLKHPAGFGSTEFHVLRPGSEIDGKYLFYMIWNPLFRKVAGRNMTGTAGQKRVPSSFLKDFKIPLPPLPEQKRIAAILDKADSIRRKRQGVVRLTEELLRSVFLDMFGDPVTNPKGWEMGVLGDVIYSAKDGPHVSPEYSTAGIPFLSARHVKPGRIEWNDLKHITNEEAKIHWRKCKPEKGDILYTKRGTTGVAAVFDSDKEIAVWVHIALLKLKHNKVNPYWLENMLNSKYCYDQSQRYTHGITNQDLGLKRMVNIEMYIPPLSEQNKFHAAVKKIKNLASLNASYFQESENILNSLLQRAFKGEL